MSLTSITLFVQHCWQSARIFAKILILSLAVYLGHIEFGLAEIPPVTVRASNEIMAAMHALEEHVYNPDTGTAGLRDPTRPPSKEAAVASTALGVGAVAPVSRDGSVLSSIIFSPHRKLAIINDRIVRVGETVGSIKVLAINADSVEVRDKRRNDKPIILTVRERFPVKTPVQQQEKQQGQ